MMFYCPFCGARRFTCWPEFWPWQYQGDLFCSENCWICDATKKQRERNGYKMARMKKDGTPAKRPGPKAKKPTIKLDGELRIETPEAHNVDIVETPEAPKRAPLVYDGYTVCCIESKTFGRFYWDRDHNHLDWTTAEGEEVSFTPTGWKMFLEELPKVAAILGVEL